MPASGTVGCKAVCPESLLKAKVAKRLAETAAEAASTMAEAAGERTANLSATKKAAAHGGGRRRQGCGRSRLGRLSGRHDP